MKFWDSSAILPLLCQESLSEPMIEIFKTDSNMLVWWATPIECMSALSRKERDESISTESMELALLRLKDLQNSWHEIQPLKQIQTIAIRLLRTHAMRAADSQQLAAAIVAADGQPASLPFVCLDHKLNLAASKEGFHLVKTG